MSFTINPAAARPCSKRLLFIMFQNGRAGRGLSLPTQESIRILWPGVFMTKLCTHSTRLRLAGSMNVGCSQARFSSSERREEFEDVEERPLLLDDGINGGVRKCDCRRHRAFPHPDQDAADVSASRGGIWYPGCR